MVLKKSKIMMPELLLLMLFQIKNWNQSFYRLVVT